MWLRRSLPIVRSSILVGVFFFGMFLQTPVRAQMDRGAQAEARDFLRERAAQRAEEERLAPQHCRCTRSGVGSHATFCATLIGPCDAMVHGTEFSSLSEARQTALRAYNCTLVTQDAQFAPQTSPTDTTHLCPDQPYENLEAAAAVIVPPSSSSAPPSRPAFVSITPTLGVPIPGLTFSPATLDNGTVEVPFLAQYVSAVQRYLTGLAVTAALVMIVYGGFLYLIGASVGEVSQGKRIVTDAVVGLLLALGAYTVLHLVNPNLLQLDPVRLRSIEPIDLEVEAALGELHPPDNGPIMCVAFDQCPDHHLVTVRDVLLEAEQAQPGTGNAYLLKIFGCQGGELTTRNGGAPPCRSALQRQLNPNMKPLFLSLLQQWPSNAGRLKIGEIHRRTQTQFYGFMPLRAACGPLLSGFPAPRSACPRGGHGTGSAMDVWFVPANQEGTSNCAEVVPGKPFPLFMRDAGWFHLCHEDWHFEPAASNPSARTTNVWNNVPCIGGSDDADVYLRLCPRSASTPSR